MKHLDITLQGKVQHVGLRYQIKELAKGLGLKGYARNLNDGSVYIEVEGDESSLTDFLGWVKSNLGLSEIKSVETNPGKDKHYRDFQIY